MSGVTVGDFRVWTRVGCLSRAMRELFLNYAVYAGRAKERLFFAAARIAKQWSARQNSRGTHLSRLNDTRRAL